MTDGTPCPRLLVGSPGVRETHFMAAANADRNLLFGILAFQMDFVTRDALIAAMNAWVVRKDQPLGQILVEQGALGEDERRLLEPLVEKHLARHGGDAQRSLVSVATEPGLQDALQSVADFDFQASLVQLGKVRPRPDHPSDPLGETIGIGENTTPGGGDSNGRFRLLRLHDRGGLGEVFVALDRELNREVALKQMQERHADDPQLRARFVVEAEVTGGLEHPGIVPVYGLGAYPDGRPFYAMRFIRGDNLKSAVERFHNDPELMRDEGKRTLERQRLLGRFLDVCNAVSYAHSRGVLHRDLKPGNIMLGKYGETLLVDWGLAKSARRAEPSLDLSERTFAPGSGSDVQPTEMGGRLGTPAYMSPEQAAGELDRLGPASDIYSLGATLYFVLTGKPPFQQEDDLPGLLRKVERGEFLPPSQINPRVDRALDAICLKAMALDPKDRYATARELAVEIEHWLADEPVSSWREPRRKKLERWVRRHKPLVASAASLVIVGLVALSIGTVLLGQANRRVHEQRDLARENFLKARQAVDLFLTNVSEEQLLNQAGLQPLRRKLLGSALDYYQGFVRQGGNDPNLRRQLAEAYARMGEINSVLGQHPEAIKSLEQALAILEPLRAAAPADVELAIAPARAYQALAYSQLRNDAAEPGERAARSAIALLEPLERDHPEVAEFGRRLGRCYDLLGVVGIVSGHDAQYLPNWDQAIVVLQRTIARHRNDLEARSFLVKALYNRGSGLEGPDNFEGTVQSGRQAVEVGRQFLDHYPENPVILYDFGMSLEFLGSGEWYLGLLQSSERNSTAAVELFRPLHAASPSVAVYRSWLFQALTRAAQARLNLGQHARAEAAIREARELLAKMGPEASLDRFERQIISELELTRAALLAQRGRWSEAQSVVEAALKRCEELLRRSTDDWKHLRNLIDAKALLVESRLGAGRLSRSEAISGLSQILEETEADSRRLDRPTIRVSRGQILFRQAALHLEAGNAKEAESMLASAITPLESVTASHPQRLQWKLALAQAISMRSELHRRANRPTEALADARRAVELLEPAVVEGSGYLYELAAFQTTYRGLALDLSATGAKHLPEVQTIVDSLNKATSSGFDDVARLRKDPRLKLLRERQNTEFERIVAAAVAASQPANSSEQPKSGNP